MPGSLQTSALETLKRLRDAGHEAYFVGGCVRDQAMGIPPADYDIATSAKPGEIRSLFRRTFAVGEAFGVMLVLRGGHAFEVATFRSDGAYHDGRRPQEVAFGSARQDALRRDFTINGLFYDPLEGRTLDWVGGLRDIRGKLVRAIGDPAKRFEEDRLRMMRAVRFAARFGYGIEEKTAAALARMAPGLADISRERIGEEAVKIFSGPHAGRALKLLEKTGLLRVFLPEAQAMAGVEQPEKFHPEGDVFEHTCLMLDMLENPSPELALGVLLHDAGKPGTMQVLDRIRFNEHDKAGAEIARAACKRLKYSNERTRRVVSLVENHMRFAMAHRMKTSTLKRLMAMPHFEDHLELHRLDCLASHGSLKNYEHIRERMREIPEEEVQPPPLLTGRDLIRMGRCPGPAFGKILSAVREKQLEGELRTNEEAQRFAEERWPG